MAAKPSTKSNRSKQIEAKSPTWLRLALALTLVPMLIGFLLIGAWALDIYFWDSSENQIVIGVFFILAGFTISNALQKRWRLAAGWLLLLIADWLLVTSYNLIIQGIAFFLGAAGLVLLAIEFYRSWQRGKQG